jgi:hypothetical protein
MAIFQHLFWGFEFTYPDDWHHKTKNGLELFASQPEALDIDYAGPYAGYILVRADWNVVNESLEEIWNRHLGLAAGLIGAKKVGSAPWRMAGATGFEAEIVLPKKESLRLWTGILSRGFLVLNMVVSHPKESRNWFEPIVTKIISSLRFPSTVREYPTTLQGVPLPPEYKAIDPRLAVDDIPEPAQWQAFDGESSIGALQAFYLREALACGWQVQEYVPFPIQSNLGFARLTLSKDDITVILGLLPKGEQTVNSDSSARVVIKTDANH